MDPGLQLTSVSPHDIFALAATGVCSKKFYETLFARAATVLQLQSLRSIIHIRGSTLQHKIHPAREEPEVKFCKVNSFVTGSFKLSHDAELIRHSFKVMI